jgi:hypothetical protein
LSRWGMKLKAKGVGGMRIVVARRVLQTGNQP